jgi:hypothetical protein
LSLVDEVTHWLLAISPIDGDTDYFFHFFSTSAEEIIFIKAAMVSESDGLESVDPWLLIWLS